MEKLFKVAIIHFMATAISLLVFAGVVGGDQVALEWIMKSIARFLTIPGRQIAWVFIERGSVAIWLFYLANSFLWAVVITLARSAIQKPQGGTPGAE